MLLGPAADLYRGVNAEVLRFSDRWLRFALVIPHRLYRPDGFSRRTVPQKYRGPLLHLLLEGREGEKGLWDRTRESRISCQMGFP